MIAYQSAEVTKDGYNRLKNAYEMLYDVHRSDSKYIAIMENLLGDKIISAIVDAVDKYGINEVLHHSRSC